MSRWYDADAVRAIAADRGVPADLIGADTARWPLDRHLPEDWAHSARCLDKDPERFQAGSHLWGQMESGETPDVVLSVCNGAATVKPCPARESCLIEHLMTEVYGSKPMAGKQRLVIAGGMTGPERADLARLITETAAARTVAVPA